MNGNTKQEILLMNVAQPPSVGDSVGLRNFAFNLDAANRLRGFYRIFLPPKLQHLKC
jgi:hypothetical protein